MPFLFLKLFLSFYIIAHGSESGPFFSDSLFFFYQRSVSLQTLIGP